MKRPSMAGPNNPRWNGGKSDYPHHYDLKVARKKKMRSVEWTCERCGSRAVLTHHKNGDKSDHRIDNLMALCAACHGIVHRGHPKKTSKYLSRYGMRLNEIAAKSGVSIRTVCQYSKNPFVLKFGTRAKITAAIWGDNADAAYRGLSA